MRARTVYQVSFKGFKITAKTYQYFVAIIKPSFELIIFLSQFPAKIIINLYFVEKKFLTSKVFATESKKFTDDEQFITWKTGNLKKVGNILIMRQLFVTKIYLIKVLVHVVPIICILNNKKMRHLYY